MFRAALLLVGAAAAASAQPIAVRYEENGMITVNGDRRFILGVYHTSAKSRPDRPLAESLAELADAGFHVVHANAAQLDAVHEAGLWAWVGVGTLDLEKREESEAALIKRVEAVRRHPAVLFLETVDEPAWTWMSADPRIPPEPFAEAYPIVKDRDPNHLLYMNHAPTNLVSTLQEYNAGTDIVACDIYPVNPGAIKHQYALFEDGHQGDMNDMTIAQVGRYVDKMREVAGPNRPVFMVLQGFAWEMLVDEAARREEKILYPTHAQQRFMAYQSIIRGANGLLWWGTAYTPQPSDAWTALKDVARELRDLEEVLSATRTRDDIEVTYHEIGHSVDTGVEWIAVDIEGARYLITCNSDRYPCEATLSNLHDWAIAAVLNENRKIELADGKLRDLWPRFGVHVYKLSPD